ncbi:cilia- and flagella-associated protein 251-like [Mytilus californianus]|uniref:cilia- and flagella-associated protein 251-like n=1 Tax=Mytilus californianus TaxID=6549 RepID=UPI0022453488|nr:cilia- and flagella-associated protein 251-like [Mytilus californianus]
MSNWKVYMLVDRQKDRKAKDQEKVEKEKDQEKVEQENDQAQEEEKEKVEKEKDQEKEEKEKDQEDVEKDVTQEKEETHYKEVLQDDSFLYAATLTEELGYPIVQDLLQLQMNTEEGILEFEATDISKDDEIKVGQYVAVAYESEWFAGLVVEKVDDTFKINFMKKISTGNDFKWPAKEDTSCVRKEFIFETNVEVKSPKTPMAGFGTLKSTKKYRTNFNLSAKNFLLIDIIMSIHFTDQEILRLMEVLMYKD